MLPKSWPDATKHAQHAVMIIAITGQKGGVGKSTTAVCLAVAALSRGMRVLLVDADPQGTVRTWGEVAMAYWLGKLTRADYDALHAGAHPSCPKQ